MNDTLEAMLSPLVTDYYLESILSLNRKLETFGMTDHHFEIEQIAGLQDMDGDETLLVDRITDVLKFATWRVFGGYGIIVKDALLSRYIPLLDTLLSMETVMAIEDFDESLFKEPGVAELATFVNLTTSEPEDNVLEWLEEVSAKDIRAIIESKMSVLQVPDAGDVKKRKATEKEMRVVSQVLNAAPDIEGDYIVTQLIEQGFPYLTPYNDVLEHHMEELDYMPISQRAWELYLLYLYTGHSFDSIQALIQDYTDDHSEYRQMMLVITPHLSKG